MLFFRLAAFFTYAFIVSARNLTSKRGMAFSAPNTPGDIDNANQTKSQISWQYDWGSSPPEYLAIDGIEYIPMQWGSGQIQSFQNEVMTQGAKTILTFNEPDSDTESNILPQDAASLWQQYIEPLKAQGIRLGGPAVTAASTGQPWLAEFMQACANCSVDFIPLHWYGDGAGAFFDYLGQVHNTYPNYTLWVTEYASTSLNATEVASFLNTTITFMDAQPWIERYAWFGYFRPMDGQIYNLLGDDGSLNTLGQIYVGAQTVHTQIVTQAPTPTFITVSGADNPTQGLVTTYAAYPNGAVVFGVEEANQVLAFGSVLAACIVGTLWTFL